MALFPPAFGFASPWLLLGAALAAVPIVIHLLFRRPYRDVPWAATRFLLAATKKHAKRLRLEQLLLLAVRVAVLLLVAAALARPYLSTPKAVGPDPPKHRVIVLDASYSMGHETGGRTRFALAKEAAREVIEAARPGDAFHLVRMTDLGPRVVIVRPAYQAAQVGETLDEQALTFGRADPLAALRDVKNLLRQASQLPSKEVLILSDFQQADWRPAGEQGEELRRLLDEIGKTATVRLFDAGSADAANAAVTDVAIEGSFVRTGRPVRLTATVRQHASFDRRRERVELHVDGRLVATETADLRPNENATVAFTHVFADAGPHAIQVRTPPDALPTDDARYLAVTARDRLRVLLVNGVAAGRPEQTATFYLRQALAPAATESAAGESDFEPVLIGEADLAGQDLGGFDAVVLSNVGILTDQEAGRPRAFAAAGGGVVLALGENVRPEAYNRVLADAGAEGLLPVRLGERVGDPRRPDRAFLFDASDLTHPIVRPFAGNPGTGLDADFVLAYAKATLAEDAKADVPLRFDTGDPAIVAAPIGAGRVVLLTTSIDTTWGGPWPQAGRSFLPLLHETLRFAATGRPPGRSLRVGEPIVWTIPSRIAGLNADVAGPDGFATNVPATVEQDGLRVVFEEATRPGAYTLSLGAPVGRSEAFAANVDPNEGDLTPLSEQERTALAPRAKALIPGLPLHADAATPPDWAISRWLLAAAFGLLLAEQVLTWRFAWGLVALGAVAAALVARWAWTVDPLWGAATALTGFGAVAAVAAWLGRRG